MIVGLWFQQGLNQEKQEKEWRHQNRYLSLKKDYYLQKFISRRAIQSII